jgi:hypothetical protein
LQSVHKSFGDDIGSRISDSAGDGRRNEQDAKVKGFCDASRLRKSGTIGVQRHKERVAVVPRSQMSIEGESRNDMSKFLARQVIGLDLPRFSGDVKEWSTFIKTYTRMTLDCEFSDAENMEHLR